MKTNTWVTEGFEGFSKGTFENGGQNLYVSKKGVLQRIFHYDLNLDGYPDLLFANSQGMYDRPPVYVYMDLPDDESFFTLPSNGTYEGLLEDLHGSGYQDLVLTCQYNGTHNDLTAIIYYGGEYGFSENYRAELPAPNALSVCAGDFNGDGRKDLAFVCWGKLRVFYQTKSGFNPAYFIDYPVNAAYVCAADLDGDGFCDLIIRNEKNQVGVLWGKPDGFDLEHILWLNQPDPEVSIKLTNEGNYRSSTIWKPCVVNLEKETLLFLRDGEYVVFYQCNTNRRFQEKFRLHCPGAVAATAGDLTGNGFNDLVITVFKGRDEEALCRVYLLDGDGIDPECYVSIPIAGAVNAVIANLDGKALIFSRVGETEQQDVPTPVLRVHSNGTYDTIASIVSGDCMRILAGNPSAKTGNDQVIVLNHMMNRFSGNEDVYIYLGGPDGYREDRKVSLKSCNAVDGQMCDFLDRGLVDVFLVNCYENNTRSGGCLLYLRDENGVLPAEAIELPTVHAHGAAIGDFRKSGYLDIVTGGYGGAGILILYGSEKGYSLENSKRIILGPVGDTGQPFGWKAGLGRRVGEYTESYALNEEYGEIRWLLAADFNKDGWLDLFVSEIEGSRCFILWGGPDGFSNENRTELMVDGSACATVADLNHNGWPDLIIGGHYAIKKANPDDSYITVYWGGPEGYKENRKMQLPVYVANGVTVGDYNGSGFLDIYATTYDNGRERDLDSPVYRSDCGKFSVNNVQRLFNHSGSGCVSGDFNGDGYTDLAVACHKEYGNHLSHSFIYWGGPDGLSETRKTVLPTRGPHGMSTVDPGNIMDRGPRERYTSEIFQIGTDACLRSIAWEGQCTSTSWVEIEFHTSETEEGVAKAPWRKAGNGEDLSRLGLSGFVQYRLALCAYCSCGTPRITRVVVAYDERN